MQLIKDNFVPTLIIIAASILISLAFWPLENTEFADGLRTAVVEGGGEGEPSLSGIALLLPLVKVTILMGIGILSPVWGNVSPNSLPD